MSKDIHSFIPPEVLRGQKYRHYKGGEYIIICEAIHSETKEELVAYRYVGPDDSDDRVWVRPKKMFFEMVVVGGKEVPRFAKIESESMRMDGRYCDIVARPETKHDAV